MEGITCSEFPPFVFAPPLSWQPDLTSTLFTKTYTIGYDIFVVKGGSIMWLQLVNILVFTPIITLDSLWLSKTQAQNKTSTLKKKKVGIYYFCSGKEKAWKGGETAFTFKEKKFDPYQILCYFKVSQWISVNLGILKWIIHLFISCNRLYHDSFIFFYQWMCTWF